MEDILNENYAVYVLVALVDSDYWYKQIKVHLCKLCVPLISCNMCSAVVSKDLAWKHAV